MEKHEKFREAMDKTEIVRPVKRSILTFGFTYINYYILTVALNKMLVELRRGKITVEKPQIITPHQERFEGFEKEQIEYIKMLFKTYNIKGLEYKCKNETHDVNLLATPFETLVEKINAEIDEKMTSHATIIKGVPDMWGVSIMKSIVETIKESFPSNIKDLEEHGFLND